MNAHLDFIDGIDSGFGVAIAIFRGPDLSGMIAILEPELGPVDDYSVMNVPLTMKEHNYTDAQITGSILYLDHKAYPTGSGNDNVTATISLQWIFDDGSTAYNGPTEAIPQPYNVNIGNNGPSEDTHFVMQFPTPYAGTPS